MKSPSTLIWLAVLALTAVLVVVMGPPHTAAMIFGALCVGTIVMPNEGEVKVLEMALNKTASVDPTLHLFSNNVTPTSATVLADLTEVSGGGYAANTLRCAGGSAPGVGADLPGF